MIDIYLPKNENFAVNGDMTLTPTLCDLDQSINDAWSVELEHPIDDIGRWKYIVENAVIRGNAQNGKQLYRINKVRVSDAGVYASAKPIFMDAKNDCFLVDVRPRKANGQAALNAILAPNSKYSGLSDITKKNTAYYILKNAIEAISNDDNGFLNRWGGEILYDNYTIIINKKIGSDYGFELLYGKNILEDGLRETINMEDVVTRIVPTSYNGYRLSGNRPWVNSPYINVYPTVRTKVINYPHIRLKADVQNSEVDDDIIVCNTMAQLRTELRNAAAAEFTNNEIDRPSVSINAHIDALQNKEEYKHLKSMESTLSLGDTVYCRHNKLDIVTTSRITQMSWDLIRGVPKSVTIGKTERSFIQRVTNSVSSTEKALTKSGDVIAKQISGVIDLSQTQLIFQKNVPNEE